MVLNKAFLFGTVEYNRQNSVRIIALPAANPFAADYNGVYDNGTRAKLAQAKVDYTANNRHAFSVRYLYDNDDIVETYELAENTALDFSISPRPGTGRWVSRRSTPPPSSSWTRTPSASRRRTDTQVIRPSFTSGRSPNLPQGFPRQRYTFNDTFFWSQRPALDEVRRPDGDRGPRLPRRLLRRRRLAVQHRSGVQPGRSHDLADPVHAGQRPGDPELPEHRVGLLRAGRPAAGQSHPQPRAALRLRQQPAQSRPRSPTCWPIRSSPASRPW